MIWCYSVDCFLGCFFKCFGCALCVMLCGVLGRFSFGDLVCDFDVKFIVYYFAGFGRCSGLCLRLWEVPVSGFDDWHRFWFWFLICVGCSYCMMYFTFV